MRHGIPELFKVWALEEEAGIVHLTGVESTYGKNSGILGDIC